MHTWVVIQDPRAGKGVYGYRVHCPICGYVVESDRVFIDRDFRSLEFSIPCDFMLVQKIMDS